MEPRVSARQCGQAVIELNRVQATDLSLSIQDSETGASFARDGCAIETPLIAGTRQTGDLHSEGGGITWIDRFLGGWGSDGQRNAGAGDARGTRITVVRGQEGPRDFNRGPGCQKPGLGVTREAGEIGPSGREIHRHCGRCSRCGCSIPEADTVTGRTESDACRGVANDLKRR